MATISKQGGRHYRTGRTLWVNWQEQATWLPSVGVSPPATVLGRIIYVGFRGRTIVVKPR